MRNILFLLLFWSVNCQAQLYLGRIYSSPTVRLIVFIAESNSGGLAPNSSATSPELSSRSVVQIFNNYTFRYENLDIGTNNLYLHKGLEAYYGISHGWELQLANRVADSDLLNPTYLVKAGQGGTTIAQWSPGGIFEGIYPLDTFYKRMDSAILQVQYLTGKTAKPIIFYTQGINDIIAGTSVATWKASTISHIDRIRARYGMMPVFITNFYMSGRTIYNTAIAEIATEMEKVYVIDTNGAGETGDNNHWNYAGMKLIADRIIDAMLLYGY